jgi:hypothetical protein
MTSRNLKRIAASGATAALVLAGMLLALGSGLNAGAQSESQAGRIEGTWRVQLTVRDCQTGAALRTFPALFIFGNGGTLSFTNRRPAPRPKHSRRRCLGAHRRQQLQRSVRDLRF